MNNIVNFLSFCLQKAKNLPAKFILSNLTKYSKINKSDLLNLKRKSIISKEEY